MAVGKITIHMLGEYSIQVSGKEWVQNGTRSQKIQLLMAMLLCNYGKSVSQEKLIERLWPENSDCIDPANALKNKVYRARQCLDTLAGEKVEFIQFSKNAYAWNLELPCELDTEELKHIANLDQGDAESQIALYQKALRLYKGEFMENITGEEWVYTQRAYYESLFVRCVLRLCKLFQEQNRVFDIVTTCEQALSKCPFHEEIHQILLQNYIMSDRHQKALEHYKSISEMFSRELGVGLPESIRKMYDVIIHDIHWVEPDVEQIKDKLLALKTDNKALLCEYPVFEQLCLLQLRSKSRNGQTLILALLTVTDGKGNIPPLESLKHIMQALQCCILETLRKNDFVSRYSPSQFALGLVVTNPGDGKIVMRRIRAEFSQRFHKDGLTVEEQITNLV